MDGERGFRKGVSLWCERGPLRSACGSVAAGVGFAVEHGTPSASESEDKAGLLKHRGGACGHSGEPGVVQSASHRIAGTPHPNDTSAVHPRNLRTTREALFPGNGGRHAPHRHAGGTFENRRQHPVVGFPRNHRPPRSGSDCGDEAGNKVGCTR